MKTIKVLSIASAGIVLCGVAWVAQRIEDRANRWSDALLALGERIRSSR